MAMIDINESNFDSEVLKSKVPVVVDLWAEWCGPCRIYTPIIEEVAEEYKEKLKFVKVNVDDNENIASKYGIMSIPTTLLMLNGSVKAESIGALQKEALKRWLNENIK